MPHIVFYQKIDLSDFKEKFKPIFQNESSLIRISTIFVDKYNLTALLPTVSISQLHQQYLIEISTSKSKTTIRLYPATDPTKSDEVKKSMVLVAKQILNNYSDCKIVKTNISQAKSIVLVK
jgi:hypothetical protein